MLEQILAATAPYPPHLHRHILQWYAMNHRRAPQTEAEQRRAVFEYLTRTQGDKDKRSRVLVSPALAAWLDEPDEHVQGWAPVPRLAAILYQFGRDLRRRYDLGVERDYKSFACHVALTLQGGLSWPEAIVGERLRAVLWESAPGFRQVSRIGFTRALNFVRRNSALKNTNPEHIADFGQLFLSVLSDIEQGKLPGYVLSPGQYDWLTHPLAGRASRVPVTGLVHHLVVERGPIKERELGHANVAEVLARELPGLLGRMRMPRCLRDAHAAVLGAPPAPPAAPEARPLVTVVGPLSHGSGLGAAARACAAALEAAGVECEVLNRKATWGPNDEHEGDGQGSRVHGDITIIHFNPDTFIDNLASFDLEQFDGRYNVGMFWWETSKACFAHRMGADLVDEVWVATPYLAGIFRQVTDKPVHVLRIPVPKMGDVSWASRAYFELPEDAFTFVYTFDGFSRFSRKNPLGAVEAFQRAFPAGDDGVRLVLKTQNTSFLSAMDAKIYAELRRHARADRRIVLIDETFTSNEVHALISVCDCYVALHHSEGFGYGMAEAMKLRVPVIATDYSGNVEFTTEATAWPVRCTRVPVPPGGYFFNEDGQEWVDPDLEHAAERMREVRADAKRGVKVERAYAFVNDHYDEAVVGRLYRERLAAIRAGLGAGTGVTEVAA